jgi:predicted kinase
MRKWMSDRLKRRKKTVEEGKGEIKPAPLQPAYFDKPATAKEASAAVQPTDKSAPEAHDHDTEVHDSAPQHSVSAERTERREPIRGAETRRSEGRQSAAHSAEHGQASSKAPDLPQEADAVAAEEGGLARQTTSGASLGSDSSDVQRRRRRRGRGGRGRGRSAPAQPVVANPPGVELPRPEHTELGSPPEGELPVPRPAAGSATSGRPAASKGIVVLAIGLPGSGKSSWFKRHEISPLSSDLLRALLFDDPTEQRFQDLVFSNLRSMLKARLIARRPTNYVDATNLTPQERHGWIKLAKDYGYEVQGVFFDVPLETCLERNHKRQRVVSDEVMRRMSGKLKPPAFEEGFSKITVVRVKQKE